jgi:hypothetical protein
MCCVARRSQPRGIFSRVGRLRHNTICRCSLLALLFKQALLPGCESLRSGERDGASLSLDRGRELLVAGEALRRVDPEELMDSLASKKGVVATPLIAGTCKEKQHQAR